MKQEISEITVAYRPERKTGPEIRSSNQAYRVLQELFDKDAFHLREEAICLYLNKANKVLGWYRVSTGGISGTVVDIRIVLSVALKGVACSIVMAHNHPSGNLRPSVHDIELTRKLKESARLMDITLFDHLILSSQGYFSFADEGHL